jgi:sialic acid synthase SpsE
VCAGDEVTAANVRSIRPAGGLAPDEIGAVLGRTFGRDVARGTPLSWDLI